MGTGQCSAVCFGENPVLLIGVEGVNVELDLGGKLNRQRECWIREWGTDLKASSRLKKVIWAVLELFFADLTISSRTMLCSMQPLFPGRKAVSLGLFCRDQY